MATRTSTSDKNAALDPALPQKKRARRRVVGALALCLAAAIVLPLVLDSEPRQIRDDVQVQIPSRETPITEPLPRGVNPEQAPGASAPRDDGESPKESAAPGETASVQAAPGTTSRAANSAAGSVAPLAGAAAVVGAAAVAGSAAASGAGHGTGSGAVAQKPEAEPAPARAPSPAAKAETKADPKAAPRQDSKLTAKTEAKVKPDAKDGKDAKDAKDAKTDPKSSAKAWLLQIGAFASDKGATEQAQRVRKAGLRAYTEKVHTPNGDRIRVRAGPFASREAADQARAKLKAAGVDAALIAP